MSKKYSLLGKCVSGFNHSILAQNLTEEVSVAKVRFEAFDLLAQLQLGVLDGVGATNPVEDLVRCHYYYC